MMTAIAGFLVGDFGPSGLASLPIGLDREVENQTFVTNIPPHGALLWVTLYPQLDLSVSKAREFMEAISDLHRELIRKGYRDIRMAATTLTDVFENFELRDLRRQFSPSSFDDWVELCRAWEENYQRERSNQRVGILVVAPIHGGEGR